MNKNANDLRIRMAEPDDAFTLLGIYEPYVEIPVSLLNTRCLLRRNLQKGSGKL